MPVKLWTYDYLCLADQRTLYVLGRQTDKAIHDLIEGDAIGEDLARHMSNWLGVQAARSQSKGMLVGISGGLDSAVVAALAERAAPGHNRYLFLPCQSQPKDLTYARLVADYLGLHLEIVDLDPLLALLCDALGADPAARPTPLHLMHVKFALRYLYLSAASRRDGLFLAGTGNRSEMEHAGLFDRPELGAITTEVLGHLFKSQVQALGRYLGIPEPIITREPTNGLQLLPDGAARSDEDLAGMRYADIEVATRLFMEFGSDLAALTMAVQARYGADAGRVLSACRRLGMSSWLSRYKSDPLAIGGHPLVQTPLYCDYPHGFPYPQNLENWRW